MLGAILASATLWPAMLAEPIGTAWLVFFVFALTDPRNPRRPDGILAAPFIGLTVTIIIAWRAPLLGCVLGGILPDRVIHAPRT